MPSSTEYNPKFSVYKDGMIYWKCNKGRSPNRIEVRDVRYNAKTYRYAKDDEILLVKANLRLFYMYRGKMFKIVSSEKTHTMYNGDSLKVKLPEYFDYSPNLMPLGTKI